MKKLILANPRGFCAGVTRAIEIVERALALWGSPIYVKHEIVHNQYVVEDLKKKGAIFVEELSQVPKGSNVIFSAHGVPPQTFKEAENRKLKVTDATCPLVTRVHEEAKKYKEKDQKILLIGHKKHVEVVGTFGVAPEHTIVIETIEDLENLNLNLEENIGVLTQTTLSVDDTSEIEKKIKEKFVNYKTPKKTDICFATTNRQKAIKQICKDVELVFVVGSTSSSNSNRLREVAEKLGVKAYLINDKTQIKEEWISKVEKIGMTAGASTPENIIRGCIDRLKELGVEEVLEEEVVKENVTFQIPSILRNNK